MASAPVPRRSRWQAKAASQPELFSRFPEVVTGEDPELKRGKVQAGKSARWHTPTSFTSRRCCGGHGGHLVPWSLFVSHTFTPGSSPVSACFLVIPIRHPNRSPRFALKPHPDIFLLAMQRMNARLGLGLEPRECIVYEDSEYGMQAGQAAGMHTFVIPDPNFTAEERKVRFGEGNILDRIDAADLAALGLPALAEEQPT